MPSRVTPARRPADIAAVRTLLRQYFDHLGPAITPRAAEQELADLPGPYAAPGGLLLVVWAAPGEAVGCAGLRPLDRPGACELKRLFVSAAGRGQGLGRALVTAAVEAAPRLGYLEMFLDTLPGMEEAAGLYQTLGFEPVPPYHPDGPPELLYFHRRL